MADRDDMLLKKSAKLANKKTIEDEELESIIMNGLYLSCTPERNATRFTDLFSI